MFDDVDTKLLYDEVFNRYYHSELRAWDIDASLGFDKSHYNEVISSVKLISHVTQAPTYTAPSCWAAAIFLMDKQSRQGYLKDKDLPSNLKIGETFKIKAFKVVFRGQNATHANFHPTLWRFSPQEQVRHNNAMAAFCLLTKIVSEQNFSLSLQAHLYHAAAQSYDIPTDLLDWTLDPAVAITFASSGASSGDNGIVYFTDFETEPQLRLILPPPFVRQLFDERNFFHYTSSKNENERLFRTASRVIFPISSDFSRAAAFPYLAAWAPPDDLLHEIAARSYKIADHLSSNYFDGLNSQDVEAIRENIETFKSDFRVVIAELLHAHNFSDEEWKKILDRWILEIHCFINELFMFATPDGKICVSDRIYDVTHENRDAIKLYCERMLRMKHPSVVEKRELYDRLLADVNARQNGP